MKTLQEQYTLIKEGKGHKDMFLKEAKRLYPNLINKPATYNEATKILKNKGVLTENIMGVADLSPINSIESPKASWEEKFKNFINEAGEKSLNPIVNNDMKFNTREEDEKVPAVSKAKYSMDTNEAGSYKLSKGVENIASHNYDYSPKVDNINNVNVNELQNGVYCEAKNNPELTLEEIQAKVISNLAKDPLHYVKNGQFGVEGLGYSEQKVEESDGENYGGSGFSEKVKEGSSQMLIVK